MRRILLVSGTLFLVLGGFVGSAALRPQEERSIAGSSGIAVLESGTIVVEISHDERVQIYSRDGDYLGATPVDSDWGWIRLKALEGGGFQAATVRNRKLYTFDAEGNLLSVEDGVDAFESFGEAGQWEARGPGGALYRLDGPRLIRQVGSSKEVLVDHSARWPLGSEPALAAPLLVSGLAQLFIARFGAARFRSFVWAAARIKQPKWVDPNERGSEGSTREQPSSQPPAN